MDVKELIKLLNTIRNKSLQVVISNDEELNILFANIEIAILDDDKVVLYGLSGSELDD